MAKSMYSVILTEEVVERIDRMAYERGMSRSQMIDHVLAQAAGFSTPEQRARELMSRAADYMSILAPGLQLRLRTDLGSMEAATYVKYKYNPSIKYSFDILNDPARGLCGELKLSSRSTSLQLRAHLDHFLQLLLELDHQGLQLFEMAGMSAQEQEASLGGTRFARNLYLPRLFEKTDDPQKVAERLSECITLLDESVQCYFQNLHFSELPVLLSSIYAGHALKLR